MLKLVHNWKKVLRFAWSIRLALLASLLGSAEVILGVWLQMAPSGALAASAALASLLATVARVVEQKTLRDEEDDAKPGA